jgi:hypothetical protein
VKFPVLLTTKNSCFENYAAPVRLSVALPPTERMFSRFWASSLIVKLRI